MVSPSLLSANFIDLKSDVEMINKSEADWLHMDIMDGVFVPTSPSVSLYWKPWQKFAPNLSTYTS